FPATFRSIGMRVLERSGSRLTTGILSFCMWSRCPPVLVQTTLASIAVNSVTASSFVSIVLDQRSYLLLRITTFVLPLTMLTSDSLLRTRSRNRHSGDLKLLLKTAHEYLLTRPRSFCATFTR